MAGRSILNLRPAVEISFWSLNLADAANGSAPVVASTIAQRALSRDSPSAAREPCSERDVSGTWSRHKFFD